MHRSLTDLSEWISSDWFVTRADEEDLSYSDLNNGWQSALGLSGDLELSIAVLNNLHPTGQAIQEDSPHY